MEISSYIVTCGDLLPFTSVRYIGFSEKELMKTLNQRFGVDWELAKLNTFKDGFRVYEWIKIYEYDVFPDDPSQRKVLMVQAEGNTP